MDKRNLTTQINSALRGALDGCAGELSPPVLTALVAQGLMNKSMQLTVQGWRQALVTSSLEKQCVHLGLDLKEWKHLQFTGGPERAAWDYFAANGYTGSHCEGGALLLLIRAAALDTLEQLNTFGSRQDACERFTEAQLKIHEDSVLEIAAAVERADADLVARGFAEIYRSVRIQDYYPGLTAEAIIALFDAIGNVRLRQITEAIAEDPYQYRNGWPDLTLTNGRDVIWAEIKTTDKLHMSQIITIHRMKPLMPGATMVVRLC